MDSDFQMPLILDGAMGTALMMREIKAPLPLWSAAANYENFNEVVSIHKEYIKSGSNIITTNSFRSTPRTFRKAGYSKSDAIIKSEQSLILAIEAANIARKGRSVLVAGSLAPLEDCYEPSDFPGKNIAKDEYSHLINIFNHQAVDLLLFETMGNFQEIKTLLEININPNKKKWLSIVLKNENQILDGTDIIDVIRLVYNNSVDTLLINCSTIQNTLRAIPTIKRHWPGKWGVYPNLGEKMPTKDGYIDRKINDVDIGEQLMFAVNEGTSVLGACCGSTPDTINIITENLKNSRNR